jgi:hypothetical protein
MSQEYEQMELDTRSDVQAGIENKAMESIKSAMAMIAGCKTPPSAVRNRHEAYGIAAEHLANITSAVKSAKNSAGDLLSTLPDPNRPAVEAASSLANCMDRLVIIATTAAAEMRRASSDLYTADVEGTEYPTPMEELAGAFEDAEDRTEYEIEEGDDE